MRNQVERYKRGLPYHSPVASDNGSFDDQNRGLRQGGLIKEKNQTEIKELKLKNKK